MQNLLQTYKYKVAYIICLITALYIATDKIAASSTYAEGFIVFFIVIALVGLGIFFRTKDNAKKLH